MQCRADGGRIAVSFGLKSAEYRRHFIEHFNADFVISIGSISVGGELNVGVDSRLWQRSISFVVEMSDDFPERFIDSFPRIGGKNAA